MEKYKLESEGNFGGDYREKRLWPYLKDLFPNYEKFWQSYIVPLTNRPIDIHLRDDVHPLLVEMSMAHYTIFYHLGISYYLFDRLQNSVIDNKLYSVIEDIFHHLGSLTDNVERFLFTIAKIAIDLKGYTEIKCKKREDLVKGIKLFCGNGEYNRRFEKFKNRGISVNFEIHKIREIIDSLDELIDNDEWVSTKKLFNRITDEKIRRYRNHFTHNPILLNIEIENELYIPRNLTDYELWSSVKKITMKDLIPIKQFCDQVYKELGGVINVLWVHIIDLMAKLVLMPKYKNLTHLKSDDILNNFSNYNHEEYHTSEDITISGTFSVPFSNQES